VIRARFFDLRNDVHTFGDAAEYGMARRSRREPVQVVIVDRIDEELAGATVGLARVGHRQRPRFVGNLRVCRMFVLNRTVRRIASTSSRASGIAAVRTTKLNHEVVDHAVKVQSIVETAFRELDEVLRRERHLVDVELDGEVAE